MPTVNKDRIAQILTDAIALGDKTTADKWKVSVKTIERYRSRANGDPALSAFVREKIAEQDADWADVRLKFLRAAIAKLETLVSEATVEHIHQVAGALKIVGDLHVVVKALGADVESKPHRTSAVTPAHAGGATSGAGDPSADPVH